MPDGGRAGAPYEHHVVCTSSGRDPVGGKLLMQEVTLTPRGRVHVCTALGGELGHSRCNFGNPDENTPTYRPGKVVREGRFRCRVAASAVKCAVRASGSGFLLTTQSVSRIGQRRGGTEEVSGGWDRRSMTPALDECLVGRWKEVGETDVTSLNGAPLVIRGGANRILTFDSSGKELVDYRHQAPLRGHLNGGVLTERYHGVTTYRDRTHGPILRFTHGDFRHFWITGSYAGAPLRFGHNFRNSPPVRYTCTATGHTQKSPGYFARFVRVAAGGGD